MPFVPARSILRLVYIISKTKATLYILSKRDSDWDSDWDWTWTAKGTVVSLPLRWGKFICRNLSIVAISLWALASI